MKKITLLLTILLVLSLTACSNSPFETDDEGYTFLETDELTYTHNDGTMEEVIFTYTFTQEYKMFVNEDGNIYNFKNINNYKEMSTELKALFDHFGQRVSITKEASTGYSQKQELSLGATEDDFNYEKITVDELAFNGIAYISVDNGVTMFVNFTEFTVDEESYFIPSFIQLFTYEIHAEQSWTWVNSDNEYADTQGVIVNYKTLVVPVPMKTGADSPFDELLAGVEAVIDHFIRFVERITAYEGVWEICVPNQIDDCIDESYTELSVQIYEMTISDVTDFYSDYYSGGHDGYDFVFVNRGITFVITDMEEVQVRLDNDQVVDVVNATIRVYE
jgi:hypothetical protein